MAWLSLVCALRHVMAANFREAIQRTNGVQVSPFASKKATFHAVVPGFVSRHVNADAVLEWVGFSICVRRGDKATAHYRNTPHRATGTGTMRRAHRSHDINTQLGFRVHHHMYRHDCHRMKNSRPDSLGLFWPWLEFRG